MKTKKGVVPFPFRIYKAGTYSLDYLFPPACLGCGRAGVHWCGDCDKEIGSDTAQRCDICYIAIGKPGKCANCENKQPYYEAARALGSYRARLREALLTLKYRRDAAIGLAFAKRLRAIVFREKWEINGIVPIPLARERLMERGYNQVEVFSRPLALLLSLGQQKHWLLRPKGMKSQVGLSIEERRQNVRNAFRAEREMVAGKRILLIDDVMTSGATLNEGARALKKAGAEKVFALCIARADVKSENKAVID